MESGVIVLFAFFDRGNMAHWGGPVQRYTLELRLFRSGIPLISFLSLIPIGFLD